MKRANLHIFMHFLLGLLLVSLGFLDLLYKLLFPQYYNPTISGGIIIAILLLMVTLYHQWYLRPYKNHLNTLKTNYGHIFQDEIAASDSAGSMKDIMFDKVPYVIFEKIVQHYKQHSYEQEKLVEKLKTTNMHLDQNSRFTNAIVKITSEILRSGDIHDVLQLILDKAIEIIPNAQKGSILFYHNKYLEYKAMRGYNMEALKDFRFTIDEIFQYNSKDLYEPVIIHDVEEFNRNLKKDKFTTLKESSSFELKSCISCAISLDNQFYGIINIDNVEDNHAFSEEHKPIIKYFAEQIGIALKNAQLLERTIYLSRYDSLTGISNRSYMEEQLDHIFHDAQEKGKSFCLVSFDMNNLKCVNDHYGHEAGDQLIVTFTSHIASMEARPEIFGRIGGDEFAMVYIGKTKQEVADIIQGINAYFRKNPFKYNGVDILNITYGYGISSYPDDADDLPTLLRLADKLMYDEKKRIKECNHIS